MTNPLCTVTGFLLRLISLSLTLWHHPSIWQGSEDRTCIPPPDVSCWSHFTDNIVVTIQSCLETNLIRMRRKWLPRNLRVTSESRIERLLVSRQLVGARVRTSRLTLFLRLTLRSVKYVAAIFADGCLKHPLCYVGTVSLPHEQKYQRPSFLPLQTGWSLRFVLLGSRARCVVIRRLVFTRTSSFIFTSSPYRW